MRTYIIGDIVIIKSGLRVIRIHSLDLSTIPAGSKGVTVRVHTTPHLITLQFLYEGDIVYGTISKSMIL